MTVKELGLHIPPEFGLQEYDCIYNDSGPTSPVPKGLECYQYSVADAAPDCDDFVIIEYIYTNKGPLAIDSLYSAIFMDFDILNATDNYGKTDATHRTAYMQPSQANDNPTVGICYLGSKPQSQLPVANLSVIDHGIYVYPYQGLPDNIQWKFMNGTYSFPQSDRQYDWSVVVSVGPFDLPVGAEQHVAFAIVGGESNSEYLQSCQHAIDQYDTMWPGVAEKRSEKPPIDLRISPNPAGRRISIAFTLVTPSPVRIMLYDPEGRRISTIYDEELTAGDQRLSLGLPDNLSSGVYFLRFEAADVKETKKVILVRRR